jgi:hypothetical protein
MPLVIARASRGWAPRWLVPKEEGLLERPFGAAALLEALPLLGRTRGDVVRHARRRKDLASSERRAALGPVERGEAGQAELANPLFLWVLPVSDCVQLVDLALALLVQDSFEA